MGKTFYGNKDLKNVKHVIKLCCPKNTNARNKNVNTAKRHLKN